MFNPSSNNVAVNFVLRENSDVKIEVSDINGRIVYESGLSSFSHEINLYFALNPFTAIVKVKSYFDEENQLCTAEFLF